MEGGEIPVSKEPIQLKEGLNAVPVPDFKNAEGNPPDPVQTQKALQGFLDQITTAGGDVRTQINLPVSLQDDDIYGGFREVLKPFLVVKK